MVPGEIAAVAKQQVAKYKSVQFADDIATSARKYDNIFQVETKSGKVFEASKLILASGIRDIIPDIKGFAECWGKSVIHCPYCHGYEFKNKRTGIWVNASNTFHFAPLIRNLTSDLYLLTNGSVKYAPDEKSRLDKNGIVIIESKIVEVEHKGGQVQNVLFEDESKLALDALYAALPFEQHSAIPVELGCELLESGHIKTDMFFKTTVDGVYACGDNTSPFRSVSNAVASGNFAAAAINKELAVERF